MENNEKIDTLWVATKALIINNGKALILKESASKDGTQTGRFGLPGGRLNMGESWSDALKREVLEECGLLITIKDPLLVDEWRPVVRGEHWQIVGIFFLATSDMDNVTLSDEHESYEWIHPGDYEQYNLIENEKAVFKKYLEINSQ